MAPTRERRGQTGVREGERANEIRGGKRDLCVGKLTFRNQDERWKEKGERESELVLKCDVCAGATRTGDSSSDKRR